jgi:predicted Zn-dependent peptidase
MTQEFKTETLKNGLKIIAEVNPANVTSTIGFFVKTGARDEQSEESGVSHFLEHMMFKGTATRSALDINMQLGTLGAHANAFTSEENTVYYSAVIPEKFSEMQELLSDMLRPSFDPKEFDTEKKVILEEIALYQDRPHFYLIEQASRDYFGSNPLGNSVLGTVDSVSAISREQMIDYFNRRYAPSNITLVATGNVCWDAFLEKAKELCGDWVDRSVDREFISHTNPAVSRTFLKPQLAQGHAYLLSSGPSAQDEDRYPMAILATILGEVAGSSLYWDLVHTGLAESASVDVDERDGSGCMGMYVCCPQDRLDQVIGVARKVVSTPTAFSDDDLDRAKAKVMSRVVMDGELPMGRLMSLGMEWTYRKTSTPLQAKLDRIKMISKKDIERAVERFPLQEWSEYRLVSG